MDSTATQQADASRLARCLILLPPGFDPPLDMLDGLRRRGVAVRQARHAPRAMVALAAERFTTLIVIEPDLMVGAEALVRAVRQHHDGVKLWRYRWSAEPRLSRFEPGAAERPAVARAGAPVRDRRADAVERSIEPDQIVSAPMPAPVPHDSAQEPVFQASALHGVTLSDEELAMLLSDVDLDTPEKQP